MEEVPPPEDQSRPQKHKPNLGDHVDATLKTKLMLEAMLDLAPTMTLPMIPSEDIKTHQSNTIHKNIQMNERTLLYYTEMEKALDGQLRSMDESLKRCREVEAKLQEDTEPDSEAVELAMVVTRIRNCNKAFKQFRAVFRQDLNYLAEEYPQMNIGDVLSVLAKKMIDHPNDPYMFLDELECDQNTLNMFLKINILQRHPKEPTKIKLLDPR